MMRRNGKKNEDQQRTDKIVKAIMKAHVYRGPGARKAKQFVAQQLGQQLSLYDYNRFKEIGIRNTLRNLEDFVHKICKIKIEPIKSHQEPQIKTLMLQCRRWMSEEHADTFLKFTKAQLGEKVEINARLALAVYNELKKLARDPRFKKAHISKFERQNKKKMLEERFKIIHELTTPEQNFRNKQETSQKDKSDNSEKREQRSEFVLQQEE